MSFQNIRDFEKIELRGDIKDKAEILSNTILDMTDENIPTVNRSHFNAFKNHIGKLKRFYDLNDYFILPLGIDHSNNINISIFNYQNIFYILLGE